MKRILASLVLVGLLIITVLSGCAKTAPTPAPTPTPTPTATPKPTATPTPTPTAPKITQLNMGSTSSTSGSFVYAVALGRVINKYNPDLNVTVIESGSAYDNLNRIKEGAFDFASSTTAHGTFEMYAGFDIYKGNAWKDIRSFFIMEQKVLRIYVRADSGAKTWADLKGKRFAPGIPGSGAALYAIKVNDTLGGAAEIWMSSLADAYDAIAAGRAVGVNKSSPITSYDSVILQTHLKTPLVPLALSADEVKKMQVQNPYYDYRITPKGAVKEAPDFSGYELYQVVNTVTSSKLPQEVGYKIAKAASEHWDEIISAYTTAKIHKHPIRDYIDAVPKDGAVPFHAGVVQYAKEAGINVPDYFIPPEYKGK